MIGYPCVCGKQFSSPESFSYHNGVCEEVKKNLVYQALNDKWQATIAAMNLIEAAFVLACCMAACRGFGMNEETLHKMVEITRAVEEIEAKKEKL